VRPPQSFADRVRSILMTVGSVFYALAVIGAALGLSFLALLAAAALRGGVEGAVDAALSWLRAALPGTAVLGALSALLYGAYRRRRSTAGIFAFFMGNVLVAGAGGLLVAALLR
jgi:hypothetical protein